MPAVVPKKQVATSAAIQDEALAAIEAVDLSAAPKLRPYNTLRMKDRARVLGVLDGEYLDGEGKPRTPTSTEAFALMGDMDEVLEWAAVDSAAYVEWAIGDGAEYRIQALFMDYAAQVEKSMRSAN